jgi:YjbE family integral membrane protein
MTFDPTFHGFSLILQVFLLDLILSGDNAVVIALSCRSLPPRQLNKALLIGTGAAIGLRVVLTTVVSFLLKVPLLKLIGAVLLIVIGIRLLIEEERGAGVARQKSSSGLWSAVLTVIVADLVMSLDNVVALSAVTQGNILYLTIGLVLSVLLLMFSSRLMIDLLRRYPILIPAAGALLGYIAGDIAVSDPAVAGWVDTQSPALTGLVPLLCAVFVVAESRIIERRRRELRPPIVPQRPPAAPVTPTERPAPQPPLIPPPKAAALPDAAAPAVAVPDAVAMPDAVAKPDAVGIPDAAAVAISAPPAPVADAAPIPSASRFGLSKLIGNPFIQVAVSTVLALCCIVLLPRTLDILILIKIF